MDDCRLGKAGRMQSEEGRGETDKPTNRKLDGHCHPEGTVTVAPNDLFSNRRVDDVSVRISQANADVNYCW